VNDHCEIFHPKKKNIFCFYWQSITHTKYIILYQNIPNMTTRKLACTSKEQFYDFSFFIIFHTQYLHKICIFLLFLFFFYIYSINTLRKKKKCTIIFLSFFCCSALQHTTKNHCGENAQTSCLLNE
jgi:hypothetical protein